MHYNVVWKRFGMIFCNDIGTGEEAGSVLQNKSVYLRKDNVKFVDDLLLNTMTQMTFHQKWAFLVNTAITHTYQGSSV